MPSNLAESQSHKIFSTKYKEQTNLGDAVSHYYLKEGKGKAHLSSSGGPAASRATIKAILKEWTALRWVFIGIRDYQIILCRWKR